MTILFLKVQKTPFTIPSVHSASTTSSTVSYDISKRQSSDPFSPPMVYASQEQLSAQKIFSFPGSPVTLQYSGTPKKEVLGFLPYWMLPVADQINLDGFTDVSLFGLTVDSNGNIITSEDYNNPDPGWAMWQSSELDSFIERARQKHVKVFLTIKSFDADTMNRLVASDEAQRTLIANTIQLVNSKSLDGVNVDFEYVGQAPPEVTSGFTRLIANLNSELKRQTPNAELTIDTYLSSGGVVNFFDVELLQDYVDAFVVMGYDVHSPASDAGALAPLEGGDSVLGYMQSYLERIPPSKLILAVGYYGYDWPVLQASNLNEENTDPNATDSAEETDQGQTQPTTTLPGPVQVLSYAEIAAESKRYTIQWDNASQSPYYRYTDPDTGQLREVHFENTRSLGLKYDYILNKDLRGVGVWALGYDGLNPELDDLLLEKFMK